MAGDDDKKALFDAAEAGDFDAASDLLSRTNSAKLLNSAYENGLAPLHYAAVSGYSELITLFLEKGAEVDFAVPPKLTTPLWLVLEFNFWETLDKDLPEEQLNIVKQLLTAGASLGMYEVLAGNPFHYAISKNLPKLLNILLTHATDTEQGMDITKLLTEKNMYGKTPLDELVHISKDLSHVGPSP